LTQNDPSAQSLIDHLVELRQRLLRSVFALLLVFLCLAFFANQIYLFVAQPMIQALPEGAHLQAIDPTATFFAPFKLTFFVSIFAVIPFILHQAWSFISPGLYAHEKKIALPILISSIALFYLGIAFAYFVVLELILNFLISTTPEGVLPIPDISSYLNLVLKLFFAFGFAFEIPIATVLLIASKLITAEQLKKQRPYVFVGCFVMGMLMTPPDVISQTLLAIPMWLLFECGIILGGWVGRKESASVDNSEMEKS